MLSSWTSGIGGVARARFLGMDELLTLLRLRFGRGLSRLESSFRDFFFAARGNWRLTPTFARERISQVVDDGKTIEKTYLR